MFQHIQQSVGTGNTCITVSIELIGHIGIVVAKQVFCLHQFIIGTATTELVIAGQTCVVEE